MILIHTKREARDLADMKIKGLLTILIHTKREARDVPAVLRRCRVKNFNPHEARSS